MRKFTFRLDRLLHVRKIEMERASVELSRRVQVRNSIEMKLDGQQQELGRNFNERRIGTGSALNAEAMLDMERYSQIVQRMIASTTGELNEACDLEVQSREQLLEKAKKKQVVSRFRERKFDEHKKESGRLEQKEIDDTAGIQYVRGEVGSST
ncbi:flagellar export protein FliJ [bacterium]|nr:flagellar export protein FliJ [bacterium]